MKDIITLEVYVLRRPFLQKRIDEIFQLMRKEYHATKEKVREVIASTTEDYIIIDIPIDSRASRLDSIISARMKNRLERSNLDQRT